MGTIILLIPRLKTKPIMAERGIFLSTFYTDKKIPEEVQAELENAPGRSRRSSWRVFKLCLDCLRGHFAADPYRLRALDQQGGEPEQRAGDDGNHHRPVAGGVNADGVRVGIGRAQDNHYDVGDNRDRG